MSKEFNMRIVILFSNEQLKDREKEEREREKEERERRAEERRQDILLRRQLASEERYAYTCIYIYTFDVICSGCMSIMDA